MRDLKPAIQLALSTSDMMLELLIKRYRQKRRESFVDTHLKQTGEVERDITNRLTDYFDDQVKRIQESLEPLLGERTPADTAAALMDSAYSPEEDQKKLVEEALPALAQAFVSAAEETRAEFLPRSGPKIQEKQSSATQWLQESSLSLPPGITTELPEWMIPPMRESLVDTFGQDYWLKIPRTTADDIQRFIEQGVTEGHSIRQMVNQITEQFPTSYSKTRATLVARTESTNALNSGRKAGIEQLDKETPPEVKPISVWISILADTTRAEHADLDGVEEDEEGLFNLDGFMIPWPAHQSLPARHRCNCYCSITTSFREPV